MEASTQTDADVHDIYYYKSRAFKAEVSIYHGTVQLSDGVSKSALIIIVWQYISFSVV